MRVKSTTACGLTGEVEFSKRDDGGFVAYPNEDNRNTYHVVKKWNSAWESIYVCNGLDRGCDVFATRKAALEDAAAYVIEYRSHHVAVRDIMDDA